METKREGVFYSGLDIAFTMEDTELHALKLSLERFRWIVPGHSHSDNSWEIHYIPDGHGRVTLDGEEHELTPGTLYVTGPHVEHAQIPDEDDPMREYCVYLKLGERPALQLSQSSQSLQGRPQPILELFRGTSCWFGQDTQNVGAVMKSLFSEMENRYTGYMLQVRTLLQQLLILTVRSYGAHSRSTVHFQPSSLVDSGYLIIEESFLYDYGELTLGALADRLGLSTRQTERLLRRHYGRTFQQKKTEARMSMAAILLRTRKMSVSDTAEALGYSTPEHFSAAFRRYYGISAGEFRKRR